MCVTSTSTPKYWTIDVSLIQFLISLTKLCGEKRIFTYYRLTSLVPNNSTWMNKKKGWHVTKQRTFKYISTHDASDQLHVPATLIQPLSIRWKGLVILGGGWGGVEWSWTISGSIHSTQMFAFFRKCCVYCLKTATARQLSSAAQFTQLGLHVCIELLWREVSTNIPSRNFFFTICYIRTHKYYNIYRNVTLVSFKLYTNR